MFSNQTQLYLRTKYRFKLPTFSPNPKWGFSQIYTMYRNFGGTFWIVEREQKLSKSKREKIYNKKGKQIRTLLKKEVPTKTARSKKEACVSPEEGLHGGRVELGNRGGGLM